MSCSLLYQRGFGLGHTFASEHEDTVTFGAARAHLYPGGIWEGSVVLNVAARREGVVVEAIPSLGWDPVGWCRFSRSPPFDRLRVIVLSVFFKSCVSVGILQVGHSFAPKRENTVSFGAARTPSHPRGIWEGSVVLTNAARWEGVAVRRYHLWDGTRSGWCRYICLRLH